MDNVIPMEPDAILVVEDDVIVERLLVDLLEGPRRRVSVARDAEAAMAAVRSSRFAVVVADKNLPGGSGLDVLRAAKDADPDVEVIIITAYANLDSALEAMRLGAFDYLVKPFAHIDDVAYRVDRASERRAMRLENKRLVAELTDANQRVATMNAGLEQQVAVRTQELVDANRRLEELSLTDDVTGLYNQRFLYRRLEEEFRRARRYHGDLAVIVLDLDHFKNVNDSHDHIYGSRVLKRVGETLTQSVRNVDFCVRYGGDEFVLILPHTPPAEAALVAERIRASIAATDYGEEAAPYRLTASIGVAVMSASDADSPKGLLRAADHALYASKEAGRNCVRIMRGSGAVAVTA